jgi:hypothetical protein
MNTKLVAAVAVLFFAGLAEFCFYSSHHAVQPLPTPKPLVAQAPAAVPVQDKLAAAKTIADLPSGTLPKDGDQIFVFSHAPDGSIIGIDGDSWSLKNGKADFLVVVRPPTTVTDDNGEVIALGVMKQEIDCEAHTYTNLYRFIIGAGGKILDYEGATEPRPIKPGTTGEALMEKVCEKPAEKSSHGPVTTI